MQARLAHGFAQGMRSTLSTRITLAVFLSVILIQIFLLVPTYLNRENELVSEVKSLAKTLGGTVVALPKANTLDWQPRIAAIEGRERVLGAGLFLDGVPLTYKGERPSPLTKPGFKRVGTASMARIDVAMALHDGTTPPRILVLRMNAGDIPQAIWAHLGRIIGLILLVATFVTLAVMAIIGRSLLLPLMDLRQMLDDLRLDDGGTPSPRRHLRRTDELGDVFRAAEDTRDRVMATLVEMEVLARLPGENPNPVLRCGFDGTLLYANGATREHPGFLDQNGRPNRVITDLVGSAVAGGKIRDTEVVFDQRVYALRASPISTERYVNIYASDVTARVRAEQNLRALNESQEDLIRARTQDLASNEAQLRSIIDTMVDGLVVIDHARRIETFNMAAQIIFGYTEAEVLGQPVEILMSESNAKRHPNSVQRYMDGDLFAPIDISRRLEGRRKDGSIFPMSLAISEVPGTDGKDQRLFTGVMRDISDQIKREEDLSQAMKSAETANMAKTNFLATMSHELRTPLNGVIGMAELLLDTSLDPHQSKYAKTITDSALALLAIINDILDLSKIEAGRLELDSHAFDPAALVESVATLLDSKAQDKGITLLRFLPDDSKTRVLGDEGRIRQVLLNLTGNAVKFTNAGSVTLRLTAMDDDRYRFEVQDTGIGIAEDAQDRLFQDFTQASRSTARRYGGSGLGLAICKRLITLMGGEMGFDSWLGAGSLFWFEVQLKKADESKEKAANALTETYPPRDVLVVEDNEINRQVAEGLLGKLGHSVTCVENGQEALDILNKRTFDIVLMDVQMPEMDGYEATRLIRRKADPTSTLPIVAMTANATSADVEAAMLSGMNGYMSKPVTRARLAEIIAKYTDKGTLAEGTPVKDLS